MDVVTTQLVFFVLITLASLVWCDSLIRALRMRSPQSNDENPWAVLPDQQSPTIDNHEIGRRTVRGQMETVSRAIARAILGQNVPGVFAPMFQITERSPNRIVARKDTPQTCNQPPGMQFSEVEFDLHSLGDSAVEVDYRIDFGDILKRNRRIALGIIFGLGLPMIIGGGTVLWSLIVNHPNQAVRWQVFQTLQIFHVLWPPFLFIHQHNSGRKHARTFVFNLLMMAELADGVDSVTNA